ncbi:MAG: hypothetical protein ACE5JF_10530 [Anaerolineales bacterium]
MAESALAKKMKLRPGAQAAIIDAPKGYLEELAPLPEGVEIVEQLKGEFDWIQVFATNQADFEEIGPSAIAALRPESMLWISFPKGSSKIQTDLTRDKGWDSLKDVDLRWVNLVSVNETWSAFALRPYRPGEPKQKPRW